MPISGAGVPLTPHHPFRVASHSKTFSAGNQFLAIVGVKGDPSLRVEKAPRPERCETDTLYRNRIILSSRLSDTTDLRRR
jgi:hypothetical protein